jgi:hypothetical protein
MEYRVAEEVQGVADGLIEEHHAHLLGLRVTCLFMDKTPKSKGKEVWGRAKKLSGLPAFLAGDHLPESYEDQPPDFFVIEISEEVWRTLTTKGKRGLVDSQLCRCEFEVDEESGALKLAIVGPDVAEFEAILRRHGLWNDSVKEFVEAGAEQLTLTDEAQSEPVSGETHTWSFNSEEMGRVAEAAGALRGGSE